MPEIGAARNLPPSPNNNFLLSLLPMCPFSDSLNHALQVVGRDCMTPPSWHRQVLELARQRFAELPSPRNSQPQLLVISYGEIHCRTFTSVSTDADEPSRADFEISKRIEDLRGTPCEAYAVASLVIWNQPGYQTWALSVRGAEQNDLLETAWLQRVSFASDSGQITCHECWAFDQAVRPNALLSQ